MDWSKVPTSWAEAVVWFAKKLGIGEEQVKARLAAAQPNSRVRATAAQLSMSSDAWEQSLAAEAAQTDLEEFKAALVKRLRTSWGARQYRIHLVHEENVNRAYSHALVQMMLTEEVRQVWPYWRFSAKLDDRTSHTCEFLNNVVRPAGEAWWMEGRIPPLHPRCRSYLDGLTLSEAHAIGVTTYWPPGRAVFGHGYGKFNEEWEPDLSQFPEELADIYRRRMGASG